MSWTTDYTGPQIDEALEKGRNIKVVNNGWINLESTESSPTALANLKNPGNYITFYWTDGPNTEDIVSPLNISVVIINGKLHQFVNVLGYTYSRVIDQNDVASEWKIDQSFGILKPGASAPSSIVDGKTMWLDTSNASMPNLKLYINGEWKEVIPSSVMQRIVYDPQGKETDIFKYIEDSMTRVLSGSGTDDIEDHITNNTIHSTIVEKNKWDTAPTNESLGDREDDIKSNIDTRINTEFEGKTSNFEKLTQDINTTDNLYVQHDSNMNIHPTSAKRASWDAKANGIHNHNLDGRVIVDPAHVVGTIPVEKLAYDVNEKIYIVNSIEEMYTYTKNPVHNGDIFCIQTNLGNDWYIVIDDESLGTPDGFKVINKNAIASWANVSNTPTTIAGYGITDAATNTEMTIVDNQVDTINSNLSTEDRTNINNIASAEAARNEAYHMINQNPLALFDLVIANLESVSK